MRPSLLSSSLLLLLARLVVASDPSSEVLSLSPSDFASIVNPEELILVEFFAPWCGHCKALAPHYDEASIVLKKKGIKLAKVDCVDHADLCQQHGVTGYPTLKVFRNGTPTDYTGPRKADGIVSYMLKQSLPAVSSVSSSNFAEFSKADKLVLITFLESDSDAPAASFKATADAHRDDYLFGLTTDQDVLKAVGVEPPAMILYRSFDEPEIRFSGDLASATSSEIEAFLKEHSMPLMDEVTAENYGVYAQSGLPLAYLFIEPNDDRKSALIEALKPIALKAKGKVNFVSIDATKFVDHAKALNLVEKWPAFVIQDLAQQLKYPMSQEGALSTNDIADWSDKFIAGKLEPVLKSEPIPETQDENVITVVGKSFENIVFNDEKDVFIEFYAPWCGHCKRLKPTWDSLGDKYSELKDRIVIGKMDATENDLPPSVPFRVSGFPTLKFKPAGSREWFDYDGDRSLESLVEFVESKAKNPLDVSIAFGGKKPAASQRVDGQTPMGDGHDEL